MRPAREIKLDNKYHTTLVIKLCDYKVTIENNILYSNAELHLYREQIVRIYEHVVVANNKKINCMT